MHLRSLKKKISFKDIAIGFLDETSPQTTSNTVKVWSFGKARIKKCTTKLRANTIGFYPIKGKRKIDFLKDSKIASIKSFLEQVQKENSGYKAIIMILDNFSTHRSKEIREYAKSLGIYLVYLPPYSPDLNPIEFTWKSLKRVLSTHFIKTVEELKKLIHDEWLLISKSITFASYWIEEFMIPIFITP